MTSSKREVRILCTSDAHCGSRWGLTHPDWQTKQTRPWLEPFWQWWEAEIKAIGPVDAHVHCGDAVDGQGDKEHGLAELLTDVEEQGRMAAAALGIIVAKQHHMVYGTPYHTAGSHSYENAVARMLGAAIEDTVYLRAGGLRLSARHVASRSDTPYGQNTLAAKEGVRDMLQAMQDGSERADVVIRGHVHTYAWTDDGQTYAGICPALQLPGGVFGRTQRPWRYRVGVLELRIADGYCQARPHLMSLKDVRRRRYAEVG